MIQYSTLNVNLSYSLLNKLKPGVKNGTEATLNLSSNLSGISDDAHISRLHKAYANTLPANIKFLESQLY